MNEDVKNKDDEVSLVDLFAVLWRRKKMVIAITLSAAAGAVIFSIINIVLSPQQPNRFTSTAYMLIDNRALSAGFPSFDNFGFAPLAVPAEQTSSDLIIFLAESNSLLDSIFYEFDMVARYNTRENARSVLRRNLNTSFNRDISVFSVSFTDIDPILARDVAAFTTEWIKTRFYELGFERNNRERENLQANIQSAIREIEHLEEEARRLEDSELNRINLELAARQQALLQLKVKNELLRMIIATERPLFQILETTEITEDKQSGPNYRLLCVIVTLAAGFLSVFLAFAMEAIANIKKDPQAMAKFRGEL